MYDNTNSPNSVLTLNFIKFNDGNSDLQTLVSASGRGDNLIFSQTGQSAHLIWIGFKWRIINTGAGVS